ncbi:MAG: 50S ribosomal protein L10 [Chloroflexi bacterium]|nr:MAG: 50S ribosomal protein L10 [Chloroflexota bacterium]
MAKLEKKQEMVAFLAEKLGRSQIVIATDYRGLSAGEVAELRWKLREAGVEYRVVKNTLASFAAAKVGKAGLSEFLRGPTALAFGYEDAVGSAKALIEWQKSRETPLTIKGGLLGERLLTAEEVQSLATLPPREELLAKATGALQAPIYRLLSILSGNLRALIWVLQSRKQALEGG